MESRSVATASVGEDDQLRAHLRDMWGGVAGAWDRHADFVDLRGRQVTARMLELAARLEGAGATGCCR
jgi:hypothetical protein